MNQEPKWLVKVTETTPTTNAKGHRKATRTAFLIWGIAEMVKGKNDLTQEVITGKVHHELTGPTAEKSIREMAERMNREGKTPPEKCQSKTRLDGYRQKFNDSSGESLFDPITLKETISYKP